MKKTFDCVKMKWDIQQNLLTEYEGLSLTDRKKLMSQKISTAPTIAEWLKKVEVHHISEAKVAEKSPEYKV